MPFSRIRPDGLVRTQLFAHPSVAVGVVLTLLFALGSTAAASSEPAAGSDRAVSETVTIDYITEHLASRLENVLDVTAKVSYVQISQRDGSRSEGELDIAAIFPLIVRASWMKPDFLSGILWIMDSSRERFTQYEPTTGQALHHPLEDVLSNQVAAAIPITPEQLFSLPSNEQFALEIVDRVSEHGASWAVVRAEDTQTGKVYRIWVDLHDWLVTRMESLTPQGNVELSAEVRDIHINQGLTEVELRRLPRGTVERFLY